MRLKGPSETPTNHEAAAPRGSHDKFILLTYLELHANEMNLQKYIIHSHYTSTHQTSIFPSDFPLAFSRAVSIASSKSLSS